MDGDLIWKLPAEWKTAKCVNSLAVLRSRTAFNQSAARAGLGDRLIGNHSPDDFLLWHNVMMDNFG